MPQPAPGIKIHPMATPITCPSCKYHFNLEDVMTEEVKASLRAEMIAYKEKKEKEFAEKERQFQQVLQQKEADAQRKTQEAVRQQEDQIRKSLAGDYENQLRLLKDANREQEEKLRLAREQELKIMKLQQDLQSKEQEMDLRMQRELVQQRTQMAEQIRKEEYERIALKETEHQMQVSELKKQLDDQKKLAEEMRRKAEQGSMQLQGEVQELALENLLREAFPFDSIEEVGKGIRGADVMQRVRNNFGQECGAIIYESKRTQHFSNDWIEKLKADMRSTAADVAVIVTSALPKDMKGFGIRDGIWICTFADVKSLSVALRDGIIKVFNTQRNEENKGDKVHMLYGYLTSNEFAEQWKAISEGFRAMRSSIQKERDAMEKLWKAREKQLEKILLNAMHIQGSIEGIAGSDQIQLNLIDDEETMLLD